MWERGNCPHFSDRVVDIQAIHNRLYQVSPAMRAIVEALQPCEEVELFRLTVNRQGEIVNVDPLDSSLQGDSISGWTSQFETGVSIADAFQGEPIELGTYNDRIRVVLADPTSSSECLLGITAPCAARGVVYSLIRQVLLSHSMESRFEQAEEQLVDLMRANDSLVVQVTEDFEELTFIRSISEYLECSDETVNHLQMAAVMMEPLTRSVRAQCLALVVTNESDKLELAFVEGTHILSDKEVLALINQLRPSVEGRPFVHNNFGSTELGKRFPLVERILIVKMASSRKTLGYLVAINRTSLGLGEVEERLKDQSLMEFGTSEATLLGSAGSILAAHAHNLALLKQKEALLTSVIRAMVSAIEAKDQYTRGHSDRVALYGRALAQQLGLSDSYQEKIYLSGLLHDVGKIGVSDATLRKPGKLTDEEFEEIKKHPDEGWAILHDIEQLRDILPGVLYHHERIDGRGYPDGLKGLDIPLDGRILAVADAYDAMTSDRPYRKGMPVEKAEAILKEGSGSQWDNAIIQAFFDAKQEINRISADYEMPNKPRRHPSADEPSLD